MERIRQDKILNVPNILTMVRILLLPVVVWRFLVGDSTGALLAYLAAMLTDAVDGYLARRWNEVTAFGKLMDPLADKLLQLTMMGCLTLTGYIHWWVLAVMAAKEIFMVIGGTMLLSGFYEADVPIITAAAEPLGLAPADIMVKDNWTCLKLIKH